MSISNKKCPSCNTLTLEELGTAGYIQNEKYHNRHDWRCSKCKKQFSDHDCKCNEGSCKSNSEHHIKNNIEDGRK